MRSITIPYGESVISFDIEDSRIIDILRPHDLVGVNPYATTLNALHEPVDGLGLRSIVKRNRSAVIIADDYTRPTPAGPICLAILDELNSLGVSDSSVTVIVAAGLHRAMDERELKEKFGDELLRRVPIIPHNAWDDDQNQHLGQTSRGTPMWINKRVVHADLRITVGTIMGHFTAGYGSGPKTILPGVSGYRTIYFNHAVLSSTRSATIGATNGNPCWEDMVDALQFLGPTLAVNVVLNSKNELVAAFHGSPVAAQKSGLDLYHSIYAFKAESKADIVIASTNPEYAYLDQCLKTIVPMSMFVKRGGIRIIASPCREHLGPQFLRELYYDSLSGEWPAPEDYQNMMHAGKFKDIGDAAGILKFLQSNNSELIFVSDQSFKEDLTNLGIRHSSSIQDALAEVTHKLGSESKALIVPYGPITFPLNTEN
ncbi:MAG TPA: nickel-dependent lactate racemase [Candidatus Saccharimonadales bacterium]|nr:nickel-dependent lactate racemase [Candidatus Saccharimonadales bacterium]